jgi:hypothetical protein
MDFEHMIVVVGINMVQVVDAILFILLAKTRLLLLNDQDQDQDRHAAQIKF